MEDRVDMSGFFLCSVSNFGGKKENASFSLTCYFLPWVQWDKGFYNHIKIGLIEDI